MAGLGCPKCGRTPVIFFPGTKKWVCKNCKHEWDHEESPPEEWDDKWGPQYVVNPEAVERIRAAWKERKKKRPAKPAKKKTPQKPAKKTSARPKTALRKKPLKPKPKK
jgi:hypothetical protein